MNKKSIIFVLLAFTLAIFQKTYASEGGFAERIKIPVSSDQIASRKLDKEAEILQHYLAKFDSPMQNHAQDFIDAAKLYALDWKMLPAIAGVESTFGKQIPGGYNAYGWGVYGNQAIYFTSWTEGIYTVARGLRENYFDKGLTDPYTINRIYATSPAWGGKVAYFMQDLEKFASQYLTQKDLSAVSADPKIAAISASLVVR